MKDSALPVSRRARERLRHRVEILSAAELIFGEKGYHNATMEDIAQASQFAIGSLYKHFRSKESIFLALFEERLARYMEGIRRIADQPLPFPQKFDAYLGYFLDFAQQNQALFRIFHSSQDTADWQRSDVKRWVEPHMEQYKQAIGRILDQGVREGHLKPLYTGDLTAYSIGIMHGFFVNLAHSGQEANFREKLPIIRQLFFCGAGCPASSSDPKNFD